MVEVLWERRQTKFHKNESVYSQMHKTWLCFLIIKYLDRKPDHMFLRSDRIFSILLGIVFI